MRNATNIVRTPTGIIDLSEPKIMGVVNLTPDSFFADSRVKDLDMVVNRVGKMIEEGAHIIDLGAFSSRPGSKAPSVSEELDRLTGPLMAVRAVFPDIPISIDTFRTEVIEACADLRIDLINDISGGRFDEEFLQSVADTGLPYILMHMQGTPGDMQHKPQYEDVTLDIMKWMDLRLAECDRLGIKDILIDPGFGFGKSLSDNYTLLARLPSFAIFDRPILVGISRKSMIYKTLNLTPEDSLNGTTALHMLALHNGASILRVHDVAEAKQCIDLWRIYNANNLAL